MKAATKSPATVTTNQRPESTDDHQEQIRRRAYELFEKRGGLDGYELDDWLEAEAEVTQQNRNAA